MIVVLCWAFANPLAKPFEVHVWAIGITVCMLKKLVPRGVESVKKTPAEKEHLFWVVVKLCFGYFFYLCFYPLRSSAFGISTSCG
jgi:hypothetical protein